MCMTEEDERRVGEDDPASALDGVDETTGVFSEVETLSTGGEPFDSVEAVDRLKRD